MATSAQPATAAHLFKKGAQAAARNEAGTPAFSMLNAIPQLWQLAPAAPPKKMRPVHAEDDFDDAPTLAAVMAWLGATPRGDEAIYDLRQEIVRQERPLAPVLDIIDPPFFMRPEDSAFQQTMRANMRAHHLIAEANTTALTSAAWMHNIVLQEHLAKRRLQRRFDRLAYKAENRSAQVFTPAQQLKALCHLMVRRALHAPAPAPALAG